MEQTTPNFTKEMLKTHTILIPNMAPIQFSLLKAAMESEGYKMELLQNGGSEVSQLGLKYVHNDTCYPALLVIGQFLDALDNGNYDLDHTALIISQSGGGCRASNYIKLLRKALVKSGYGNIPVASANPAGLEKESTMPWTAKMLMKMFAAVAYGDQLMALYNQTNPYEDHKGDAKELLNQWIETISNWFKNGKNYLIPTLGKRFDEIAKSFSQIPKTIVPKVKVGIVGEIYVKFSPLGNNNLVDFLESQDCEVNVPSLMGYAQYCCANWIIDNEFYGMDPKMARYGKIILKVSDYVGKQQAKAMKKYGYYAPGPFKELMDKPDGILSLGAKMGEGWLLTAEMVELIEDGYENVICTQPFGCLPNHIAGKGVINRIREKLPNANITPIDYDPGATKVNQENRIKLMLAVAKENLKKRELENA